MRLTTRQTGIISYAGLEEGALWAAAKRMFAQSDEPVPDRFRSFLPIFPIELVQNMSYVGRRERNLARVSPAGFSTDPDEYHRLLCAELPELYTGENALRNFDSEGRYRGGGAVTVDRAWATLFPQYQPFLGERLVVHMIGGGHQAVAVPESIFPRGGGILEGAERELRVTARCAHYMAYLKTRLEMGEKYDPVRFEEDYLRLNGLSAVCVRQKELGRAMQDLCILRGLDGGVPEEKGLFTLNAKRAEGVRQYAPWRYACDTFEESPVTRATSRLLQLAFDEDAAPGDLWVSYQDAGEYIDRQRITLDVRALCEGFQIAPAYDPATRGGRYPTVVRVAAVRDRELRPLVADALNNPAYGSGMNPLGMLNKLVYLPDSRELLRQRRLALEPTSLTCENTAVGAEDYRRMRAMARWQEWKGRLVDALYRRESALSQIQVGTSAYDRANDLLTRRVEAIEREAQRAAVSLPSGQLSGYDADIDYLRRMWRHREGVPEGEKQAAERLIAEGCDVIGQHCDTPNPQTAAEEHGVWGVGYNSDMTKDAPGATLTSVMWDWSVYYTKAVQNVIDGTWVAGEKVDNYFGDMADGLVTLGEFNSDLVTDEMIAKVEEVKAQIVSGEWDVFDGKTEIMDNEGNAHTLEGADYGSCNWYYENVNVL